MKSQFVGTNLRLIRLFHNYSLTDLGEKVGVSKQFLSRLETGAESVAPQLETDLVDTLKVLPEFFYHVDPHPITDEQCHFRKQLTTKAALRQVGRARGEMFKSFVGVLDNHVELPPYRVTEAEPATTESIEKGAEKFRKDLGLGLGPVIPQEQPEVVAESLKVMQDHFGVPLAAVAREMHVQPALLQSLLGDATADKSNVVDLFEARRVAG